MGRRLNALAVFGLLLHVSGVVSVPPAAEQDSGTTVATSELHGCPQVSSALTIPFRACYVHESKVLPLLAQISAVPKMLNHNKNSASSQQVQVKHVPKLDEHGMCSATEIQLLKKELLWITRRLWQLSNRLEEPVDAQLQSLTKREIDLVRHLRNLVVYTGDSPASGMQLVSFKAQVDLLDAGFKEALATLETHRLLRKRLYSSASLSLSDPTQEMNSGPERKIIFVKGGKCFQILNKYDEVVYADTMIMFTPSNLRRILSDKNLFRPSMLMRKPKGPFPALC